jgi:plastocyanin
MNFVGYGYITLYTLTEMIKKTERMSRSKYILFAMLFMATLTTLPVVLDGLTSTIKLQAQSLVVDASNLYDTKTLALGSNIKNLVILIPNEAHESQNPSDTTFEDRLINQPYVPQNATVTEGTTVLWFNGDVDHDHKITLTGQGAAPGSQVFDSSVFTFNTASQSITMNDTGTFRYFEADVNQDDPDFVMDGTINVVDQSNSLTSTASTNIDTIGMLMVPSSDLATHQADLENAGFTILGTHHFNDIRGGDPQTLIV